MARHWSYWWEDDELRVRRGTGTGNKTASHQQKATLDQSKSSVVIHLFNRCAPCEEKGRGWLPRGPHTGHSHGK